MISSTDEGRKRALLIAASNLGAPVTGYTSGKSSTVESWERKNMYGSQLGFHTPFSKTDALDQAFGLA